eukprot:m.233085 g.233085  ORF g.233085 m.233085 type:complete len:433 (+) comp18974_c0_seq1:8-1306(+)
MMRQWPVFLNMDPWLTVALVIGTKVFVSLLRMGLAKLAVPKEKLEVPKGSEPKLQDPPLDLNDETVAKLKKKWADKLASIPATGKQYLVIGCGFLGQQVIKALHQRGEQHIRVFDLVLPAASHQLAGVQYVQGNVVEMDAVRAACKGVDVVYSTFAVIRYWETLPHQLAASVKVNVDGTNTVVEACLLEGVGQLISTSTSNVNITRQPEMQIFNEDTPYVTNENAPHHYAYTKMIAEILVLQANSKSGAGGKPLLTTCVRPCSGIFGARDRLCVQRMLELNRYEIVVTGLMDWVYVDNVVWGHLLAEKGLNTKPAEVAGKAFCVSNSEAMTIVDLAKLVQRHNPALTLKYLPRALILGMAALFDKIRGLAKGSMLETGEVMQLSNGSFAAAGANYILQSDRASRVLGYAPVLTIEEGVVLSVHEFREKTKAQ